MGQRDKHIDVKPIRTRYAETYKSIWRNSVFYGGTTLVTLSVITLLYFIIGGKILMSRDLNSSNTPHDQSVTHDEVSTTSTFPIGVDPDTKEIVEDPTLGTFINTHIAPTDGLLSTIHANVFTRIMSRLTQHEWYQNLASLSSRILVVESGERKEEITDHFGKVLKWDDLQKKEFLTFIENSYPHINEGKIFPGTYTSGKDAQPSEIATLILDEFNSEVLSRYTPDLEAKVPLTDALTIASLLEREAKDFDDMRYISGVIWNRLFIDMRLQLDATLQYAKGTKSIKSWWPKVLPDDKYLTSEYNTYKFDGLPPSPIANPSFEAIVAALNPVKTDCLFYFHDKKGGFHCTETYEEHKALLKQYYGKGK